MKLVTFTVEEANRLLGKIRPRMERLVEARAEFDLLRTKIEALTLAVSGASRDNPDALELRSLRERRDQAAERIAADVAAIHRSGCLVKDMQRGLVDFYAIAGDRLVFLCWQLGEPEVGHWHTLEGGFTQRQPLHRTERE